MGVEPRRHQVGRSLAAATAHTGNGSRRQHVIISTVGLSNPLKHTNVSTRSALSLQDGEEPLRTKEDFAAEAKECDPHQWADVDASHGRDDHAGWLEERLSRLCGDAPRQLIQIIFGKP